MAATIVDIAREVNMTHGTVSRALRDSKQVNIETRERIKEVARRMGYRPHHAGKALKSGKTHTIGVIVPDLTNPFYVELLRAIQNECLGRDYEVFCIDYAMNHKRERSCLEKMLGKRCDGIITIPGKFDSTADLLDEFWECNLPCVAIGLPDDIGDLRVDGINVIIESGIDLAIRHLVSYGHKKIVFAGSWPEDSFNTDHRFGSFEKLMNQYDLSFSVEENTVFHFSGNQISDGRLGAEVILTKLSDTTGIIATNDYMAIGMIQTLNHHGVSIPEDISIVGTDNTWIGQNWLVPLTSIDQRTQEQAKAAVDLLFQRLASNNWEEPRHLNWPTSLTICKSTGPVRSNASLLNTNA